MRCVIVDDEPQARKLLETYLHDIHGCQVVKVCGNAIEAYQALQEQAIDVLFLDIKMPVVSGIEFLKSLKKPPLVIFTTAYQKYALEGYELNVIDYLLKPISFTRLLAAVEKAKERLILHKEPKAKEKTDFVFIKQDTKLVKILLDDILYVEGMQNYVKLQLKNQKTIVAAHTMKGLEELLPENEFIRIHRSYIVAISAIAAIAGNTIEIASKELPIGSFYRPAVAQIINSKKV